MVLPESRLFCRLDGLTVAGREQQRQSVLARLGLLEGESLPVFEEAVQTAASFVDTPICWLSVMDSQREWLKAAVGLSRLGLMNPLAMTRELSLEDSFGVYVMDSQQAFAIGDAQGHPALSRSLLVQQYGIRAYLGVPLIVSSGECIGVLAVLDRRPRDFSSKDLEFLMMTARLSMSECERMAATRQGGDLGSGSTQPIAPPTPGSTPTNPLKFELLAHLTQELRTPLTSVMGMASVLTREIYGPLTGKQREYLDIIHHSGQYLLSLVKEILELSALDESSHQLNLSSVDIEMLCQQAIGTLEQAASRREQQIRLTVEPGNRIWCLDKDKIRQMLYHLIFSVIQASNAGSVVRLHVSHKNNGLRLTVWVSHPCLGDGLPYGDLYANNGSDSSVLREYGSWNGGEDLGSSNGLGHHVGGLGTAVLEAMPMALETMDGGSASPHNLGLLLSRQLAEMHGGQIMLQGAAGPGYRYVITLPRLTMPES